MAEYPDARLGRDNRTVLCNWGWQQCGGVLGYWDELPEMFSVPPHIKRTEDIDGLLYEEPENRRRRRKRGLSSDHRLRSAFVRPMVVNREVELPARVRCPECRRLNWVRRSADA